jgi:putative hydrolase of the HAD superfamily
MSTFREISIHGRVLNTLDRLGYSTNKRDRAVSEAVAAYYRPWLHHTRHRANCHLILQHLGTYHRLAIVSNFIYPPVFHRIVDKLRLRRYFDSIVVSGEVGYIKPSSRIFRRALASLRSQSQNAIMIGDDSYADIFGASRIGMMTIQIDGIRQPGTIEPKPTARIERLAQLPKVVAAIEATRTPRRLS